MTSSTVNDVTVMTTSSLSWDVSSAPSAGFSSGVSPWLSARMSTLRTSLPTGDPVTTSVAAEHRSASDEYAG